MAILRTVVLLLAVGFLASFVNAETLTEQAKDAVSATTDKAKEQVQDMQRDLEKVSTGDTVAWAIVGLMVGGLIGSLVSLHHGRRIIHLFAGAVGGVIGGALSHLVKINMDLGQVTLRYEDVLAAVIFAAVLVIVVQVYRVKAIRAKQKKEAAKV